MSRPEIDLRLRFNDTAALVSFLTKPPPGVRIVVEEDGGTAPTTPPVRGKDKHPRRLWTTEEEERLLDLYTGNVEISEIGRKLSRSYSAIYSRSTADSPWVTSTRPRRTTDDQRRP